MNNTNILSNNVSIRNNVFINFKRTTYLRFLSTELCDLKVTEMTRSTLVLGQHYFLLNQNLGENDIQFLK